MATRKIDLSNPPIGRFLYCRGNFNDGVFEGRIVETYTEPGPPGGKTYVKLQEGSAWEDAANLFVVADLPELVAVPLPLDPAPASETADGEVKIKKKRHTFADGQRR
jgi:hypothetical protein